MNSKDFGARIRQIRREKNLTQEALAEMINVSPSFLGHVERGTRVASIDTLIALCNKLNVSPEYLLCGSLNHCIPHIPDAFSERDRAKLLELWRLVKQWGNEEPSQSE